MVVNCALFFPPFFFLAPRNETMGMVGNGRGIIISGILNGGAGFRPSSSSGDLKQGHKQWVPCTGGT